jgi:hypothetical protein
MSTLGRDRGARWSIGAAFALAAVLVVTTIWSTSGDAPAHWARARFTLIPLLACAVAALLCARGAWLRRGERASWIPLAGAAATALAAIAASLSGRL